MLGQSTWVGPGAGEFRIDLAITANDAADQALAVDVYPGLITRSAFQSVLAGNFPEPLYQNPPVPLNDLRRGPEGAAQLEMPVNSPSGGLSIGSTGVYPVQVFLQKQGLTQGRPLTTFLVYAASGASSMKHLGVALVVPLQASVPLSPSGSVGQVPLTSARALEEDAATLAGHRVAVTLQASVLTLEGLARGPSQEREAVSEISQSVATGDEVLPATSLPLDVGSLVSSGLVGELEEQLSSGDAALTSLLGAAPSLDVWVFNGQVAAPELEVLSGFGVNQVVVPEAALSTLPAEYLRLTFAQPAKLDAGGADVEVLGADSELSQRISEASVPGQAVLVAEQVLAELAMIDLEAPNDQRGVVLLPPAGKTMSPTFLSVVLSGLQGNPLLEGMTITQEFASVPSATVSGSQVLVRNLQSVNIPPLRGSAGLPYAMATVSEAADVYGTASRLVTGLYSRLFISTSSVWNPRQRALIIRRVLDSALSLLHRLRLASTSITLTARHGRLPLTVLSSAGVNARVRLVLSSEELSFVGARFGAGSCTPLNPGSEQCSLDLARATTTLQIPVVVRTPGAFQLALEIETPGGEVIAKGTDTIRSTAVGGLGLVLMVGAALFLLIWWARNARHGRRARKLVPAPSELDGYPERDSFVPAAGVPTGTPAAGTAEREHGPGEVVQASPPGGRNRTTGPVKTGHGPPQG